MFFDFVFYVRSPEGNIPTPFSESSICVDGFYLTLTWEKLYKTYGF